jgi:DNA-binding transcriptional MerR regulator
MSIKMSELSKQTETTKSTILYYIKEGLLPEPQKPKPNVHLYDERSIEIIKFIKYLQKNFSMSIHEIKAITQHEEFDLTRGFEALLETLDVIMGSAFTQKFRTSELCEMYTIKKSQLEHYIDQGLLFMRDGFFTKKEVEILESLLALEKVRVDHTVLKTYVDHARTLAEFEVSFAKQVLENDQTSGETIKALFDTTLLIKPYIFNMHTLKAYQEEK